MTTAMKPQFEIKQYAYASDLKSRALNVLLYLTDRANKQLTCFPSIATIGRQLHISVSTVKRAMKELLEKGFLKREARFSEKKNGGQTSNLYTLSIPQNEPTQEEQNEPQSEEKQIEEVTSIAVETAPQEPVKATDSNTIKTIKMVSFETFINEKKKSEPPVQNKKSTLDITNVNPGIFTKMKEYIAGFGTSKSVVFDNVDGGGVHFDTPFNYSV